MTTHAGKDGKIRVTAFSTEFYLHMMAGGALFRASLAAGMQELGFGIERDGSVFRLTGIDEALCERFSQRRAEIVAGILKHAGGSTTLRDVLRTARGRTSASPAGASGTFSWASCPRIGMRIAVL